MLNTKRSWIIALIGIGLTLIAAGLSPFLIANAQESTPEATQETLTQASPEGTPEAVYIVNPPPEVTGDNSYCLICHSQPWQTVTLGDGTIQNLYVVPSTITASVHGDDSSAGALGCVDCHGQDAFPHNNPTPTDGRAYTLYAVSLCAGCHVDEVDELQNGLHEQAILAGNTAAAVCTDCHGSHSVQPVVEQPELIAGVCGDCHENTLAEWRVSNHVEIGPLGCATCHSPHSQELRVGNTTDELCMNCHDNETDRFIHVQHTDSESPVACVDCHMYTGEPHEQGAEVAQAVSVFDKPTGHTMLMDATPCTTCHEELVTSGEWDLLVANREPLIAPTQAPESVVGDDLEAAVVQSAETSYIPLIQGLILGLGFGVTFAAVFIVRGNHKPPVEVVHSESAPSTPEETTIVPPTADNADQADSSPEDQA